MKKIIVTLCALFLMVGLTALLGACGDTTDSTSTPDVTTTAPAVTTTTPAATTTTPTAQTPALPEGYQAYNNGAITFAYPEDWTSTDGSTVILLGADGNNITIVYEEENPLYASMTLETFNEQMAPALEAMGITLSNAALTQTENENGLAITKIRYTASVMEVTMGQTMYITTVGGKTYTVTITEVVDAPVLLQTVFDTLSEVK